jgi:hypothetical protein
MGFSTLLDIIGSTIIGGLLLMILFRMNDSAIENNYNFSGEKIVQQNLVDLVKLVEYDFRKIGYCADYTQIPDPTKSIIHADSNSITFLTDTLGSRNSFGNGIVDIIEYSISDTTTLSSTPNPKDRLLYRRVNNETLRGSNLGVTQFKLTFFDANGDTIKNMPASPPLGIVSMQIDIAVENPYAYGNNYSYDKKVIWRQIRLAARNFTTR